MARIVLLAVLAVLGSAITTNHFAHRTFLNRANVQTGNSDISLTAGFLAQPLDHFSASDSRTFSQRYFYSQHFTLHQKTAFLFISDNSNFATGVLTDERNPIVKAAKQFGATTFSLEHRYYGLSKPDFTTFNGTNLQYLTSQQAVEDIITFIRFANVQFGMDHDVRWVLWGAGYGGILAAKARQLEPVLVSGVVASSTPITPEYDFWQYNDHVSITFMQTGGSMCYQKIQQGFADIRESMKTPEGRQSVSQVFKLNPTLNNTNLDYNDIQMFYLAIISPFQEIVQFNNDFSLSIGDLCATIDKSNWTNTEVIYQAYVYVATALDNTFQLGNDIPPLVTSFDTVVQELADSRSTSPYIEQRMWQYQICSELGWFYTTNNNEDGLFGPVVPASIFLNLCLAVFPDVPLLRDSTSFTANSYYGPSSVFSGTNAVFTYGYYDPWRRLGLQGTDDFSVVNYVIPLASYASDFFPGNNSNLFVDQAHLIMLDNIDTWVNGPRNPVTSVNATNQWTRPVYEGFNVRAQEINKFSALSDDVPSKRTYPEPRFKKVLLGRPPHGFLPEPDGIETDSYPVGFEQGTFRQRVNHFDNTNPEYFQQKYFKNAQWAKTGGPNFLMIGGEGPESSRWVLNENITYLTWAKKYGATVYLLEHRFYGDSVVGDNTDFSKLSSLQMLYDLAEFIRAINYRTGSTAPWITFGGSYSGAMSAWMREVFPDLVVGAVASSGPVYAKTDFYEYLLVVENAIRTYNADCAANIQTGFDTIRQLFLTKEGRQNLTGLFQLDPPFGENVTDTDQHYFFSNVYGNFQGAVQYSGDNTGAYANGYGIPDMCNIMTNSSNTPLQNIVKFNEFMTIFYNGGGNYTGMDNNYQDMIDDLKNAQAYGPSSAAGLLWTWQTCSEFGYFQSADSGNGIFGSPTPVNMFVQMCIDLFGNHYERTALDDYIQQTNYKYGSRNKYRASNVIFPNGNVDPWHALGLYNHSDPSVVSYLIDGTAHCADMYPARDADVPGLKIVRDLIDQNIASWLNQPNVQTTTTSTTTTTTTPAPGASTATVTSGSGSTVTPGSSPSTTTVRTTTKSASHATILVSFAALFARIFLI